MDLKVNIAGLRFRASDSHGFSLKPRKIEEIVAKRLSGACSGGGIRAEDDITKAKEILSMRSGSIPEVTILGQLDWGKITEGFTGDNWEIANIGLSIRVFHALKNNGVNTIGDIASHSEFEIYCIRGLGRKGLVEVKLVLLGLDFVIKSDAYRGGLAGLEKMRKSLAMPLPSSPEVAIIGKIKWEKITKGLAGINKDLDDIGLSSRALHALKAAGIDTAGDLASFSEDKIFRLRDFGRNGLVEAKVKLVLLKLDYALKPAINY